MVRNASPPLRRSRDEIIQALKSLLDNEGSSPSVGSQTGDSPITAGPDVLPEERTGEEEPDDRVTEPIVNRPPVAHIVVDQAGAIGDSFVLVGSRSQDDGVIRAFSWRQVDGPRAVLSDTSSGTVSFVPAEAGTYVFELVVVDDQGLSSAAVTVTVVVEGPQRESLGTETADTGISTSDDGSPDTNRQVGSDEQDEEDVAPVAA